MFSREVLESALTDPMIEGVYETKMTLLFRALLSTSCVVKVSRGVTSLDTFTLEELDSVSLHKQSYLAKDAIKHVYFYHHRYLLTLFFTSFYAGGFVDFQACFQTATHVCPISNATKEMPDYSS